MSTTVQNFYDALIEAGYSLKLDPADRSGSCNLVERVVTVGLQNFDGTSRSMVDVAIIGLHEMGHANVTTRSAGKARAAFQLLDSEEAFFQTYADEVAAWAWAETRIAPEDFDAKERIKAEGLSSYAGARPTGEPNKILSAILAQIFSPPQPRPTDGKCRKTGVRVTDVFKPKKGSF